MVIGENQTPTPTNKILILQLRKNHSAYYNRNYNRIKQESEVCGKEMATTIQIINMYCISIRLMLMGENQRIRYNV